ncbi:MAG TPA: AI-2E family transporter YdiK [Nitrospiraceae bacterium]|jgi:predicted PurR-regulated permease PerM|nr:AI-2E family transporter YdiK [Nitrospiraceae bacterium]HSV90593.1 AI-2E family transporter YdiK [Nitrospiraceae bacterium]
MAARQFELTRDTLAVVFLFALIAASVWILLPFLAAVVWATMIVVATWPLLLLLQRWLLGRRWLAVTVMTLLLLAIFVLPFSFVIGAVMEHYKEISAWTKTLATLTLPPPPDWLVKIPLVGARAAVRWQQVAELSHEDLAAHLTPYVGGIARWVAEQLGSLGLLLGQIVLTVLVSAVLYATGESAAAMALRFGSRLAGAQGEQAIRLAGQAIYGVALGVVLTAFVHAVLGGIGLAVAGVPFSVMLTAVMFISATVQIGVIPVMLCAVAWLYWTGDTTWGTVLLVWTLVISPVDNILRPILIKQGADLPLLLIIAGVLGGLLAFGIVGLFVGPVVLAVAYTLFTAWIGEDGAISRSEDPSGKDSV